MHLGKRAIAEFFGTFWLTFGGCGAAARVKTKIDGAVPLSVTQTVSSAKTRKSRNYPSWLAERSTNVYRSFTVCAIPIRVSRLLPCMGLARMRRARKSRAKVLALRGGGKKGPGLC